MITTGGEGKVPPRKRIRGKIGNPSSAPELKSHNLFRQDNDTNVTFYQSKSVYGNFTNADNGSWYPVVCFWPTLGTSAHQRVGKKIRVKLLRLKGYVAYSPFLITQVRYRIVLYRSKKAQYYTHNQFITPMYSSFTDLGAQQTAADAMTGAVKDYYCSFFNKEYMKEHDIKRRVLFRGLIKPQPDVPNFTTAARNLTGQISTLEPTDMRTVVQGKIVGETYNYQGGGALAVGYFNNDELTETAPVNVGLEVHTGIPQIPVTITEPFNTYDGQFQRHVAGDLQGAINQRGFFPLDVTVNMNDNVDCEQYVYTFVVETDWVVGQDPGGFFGTASDKANFFIYFVPQIYYTDD